MLAFGFLTVGIVLGAWWSYESLGWGGFWGWDPVENAALLPWLTATAYLHSAMVQERRGLLRIWNLSLLIATFSLTILGTFLTRSGVIQSVHSFSDSGIGPAFIALFGVVVVGGIGLIGWRGDRLRSSGSIDAPISPEGAFLVNNLLFATFAFVVLLGTVLPLFVASFSGQQIRSGGRTSTPSPCRSASHCCSSCRSRRRSRGGGGRPRCCATDWRSRPGSPWRPSSSRLGRCAWGDAAHSVRARRLRRVLGDPPARARRDRRSPPRHRRSPRLVGPANGGMIVHIGVVVIAVGLTAASSYGHQATVQLAPGHSAVVSGHRLTFAGWKTFSSGGEVGVEADVETGGRLLRPRVGVFDGSSEATATPAVASGLIDDVYVSLESDRTGSVRRRRSASASSSSRSSSGCGSVAG